MGADAVRDALRDARTSPVHAGERPRRRPYVLGPATAALALVAAVGSGTPRAARGEPPRTSAEPSRASAAETALAVCKAADALPDAPRLEALRHGLAVAESAAAADPNDARAHLAVFCNLGKGAQLEGAGVTGLRILRRLRQEIDVALALAPDDPEALAAKGAFLLQLPGLLGGDAREAERLLRRAVALDGDNGDARRYLAQALARRGAVAGARRGHRFAAR